MIGDIFETKHQGLASYLVYAGLVLMGVRRDGNGKSLMFEFDDPDGSGHELEQDFFTDRKITSARALLDAADEVRAEVKNFYRTQGI